MVSKMLQMLAKEEHADNDKAFLSTCLISKGIASSLAMLRFDLEMRILSCPGTALQCHAIKFAELCTKLAAEYQSIT
eukprot:1627799-Amphidinium_carterae.1